MSYSTVLAVTPDRRPSDLAELRNSHGWAPSIWGRMLRAAGIDGYMFGPEGERELDRLWKSIETLPEWQQAALVLTFDTGVIPWQAFEWAADGLAEFDAKLPSPDSHVNHIPTVVDLLRARPEAPLVGIWGTSVTENPFDPWDEDADGPGSGLPLSDLYLLPQHRSLALAVEA